MERDTTASDGHSTVAIEISAATAPGLGKAGSPAAALASPAAPALTWAELRRKRMHILPGFIPLLMCFVYHEDPLPAWNLALFGSLVLLLMILVSRLAGGLRRTARESWLRTCLTYAVPPLLVLMAFPGRPEYAGVVLTVLAFGDPAAAVIGLRWGRRRLPWNGDKSWAGLIGFMVCAVPFATLAFWGEALPAVSPADALLCATTAAVLAAVAESLRLPLDDNLRISLAATLGVVAAGTWIGLPA